jgi:hypothetical protein
MNKATIDLSIKAVDESKRLLEGWASRPEEDRVGDIMVPQGAIYQLPMPFLLDHDQKKAVGEVDRVEVTAKGIKFWAHIKKIDEDGEAKSLTDHAWTLVKSGLRRSVSIGYRVLDAERLASGAVMIKKWGWFELSAVSVPALASASITSFKSVDGMCFSVSPARDPNAPVRLLTTPKPQPENLNGAVRLIRS